MDKYLDHILVVDDDHGIRDLVKQYLNEKGYLITTAKDAFEAKEKIDTFKFDLIILDVMMPNKSGLELTLELKKETIIPIILLTARGETSQRIDGLEIGADDYISKPFEPKELLLRMKNLIQKNKYNERKAKIVKFGPYSFNLKKEVLKKNGKIFFLTSTEVKLLCILAKNEGKPIFRYSLSKVLNIPNTSRALDVQVTRLRNKIENNKKFPTYIQTVRGRGYVLKIE